MPELCSHMSAAPVKWRRRQALRRALQRLASDRSGVSMLEFALILPVFLSAGFFGIEVAYMATTNMQVSDLALSVADNASRLGQTDNGAVTPTISEGDVDSIMKGAVEQGQSINFSENGRVILSSLEKDAATGRQYIHWQRCTGGLDQQSAYGTVGAGLTGTILPGLGRAGSRATAPDGQAVMFAEVYYRYRPLIVGMFVNEITFRHEAAFLVRDDRNLSGGGGDGIGGSDGRSQCI